MLAPNLRIVACSRQVAVAMVPLSLPLLPMLYLQCLGEHETTYVQIAEYHMYVAVNSKRGW